jgi:hypothetical protein
MTLQQAMGGVRGRQRARTPAQESHGPGRLRGRWRGAPGRQAESRAERQHLREGTRRGRDSRELRGAGAVELQSTQLQSEQVSRVRVIARVEDGLGRVLA